MATLDINAAPETKILRAFETILKCDPTLKRVVKVWRTWREKPGQNPPFAIAQVPPGQVAIRITPTNGPDEWLFPGTFKGAVYLHFECLIQGGDADDPLNLWHAIKLAFYTGVANTQNANQQALIAAGAYTGLPLFSAPFGYAGTDATFWECQGTCKIETMLTFNS